jgi:hypothetical protein
MDETQHIHVSSTMRSRATEVHRSPVGLWKPRLHFLDVGETGGDALRAALEVGDAEDHVVVLHGHSATVRDLPDREQVLVFLRDPLSRFVAAFDRRKAEHRSPSELVRATEEALAFERFPTPTALGEALADDPRAVEAMQEIRLVRDHYLHWFGGWDGLEAAASEGRIYGVLRTEDLSWSLASLLGTLGVPDAGAAAARAATLVPRAGLRESLSPAATTNLRRWFAPDDALLVRCAQLGLVWPVDDLRPDLDLRSP